MIKKNISKWMLTVALIISFCSSAVAKTSHTYSVWFENHSKITLCGIAASHFYSTEESVNYRTESCVEPGGSIILGDASGNTGILTTGANWWSVTWNAVLDETGGASWLLRQSSPNNFRKEIEWSADHADGILGGAVAMGALTAAGIGCAASAGLGCVVGFALLKGAVGVLAASASSLATDKLFGKAKKDHTTVGYKKCNLYGEDSTHGAKAKNTNIRSMRIRAMGNGAHKVDFVPWKSSDCNNVAMAVIEKMSAEKLKKIIIHGNKELKRR
jgi:hypothetical protein